MTDRPPGRRDHSDDAQPIPQHRRGSRAPAAGHERRHAGAADATRAMPAASRDPYHGWHEDHEAQEWESGPPHGPAAPGRPSRTYAAGSPTTTPVPQRVAPAPAPARPAAPPPRGPRLPAQRRRHPVRRAMAILTVVLLGWLAATIWAVNSSWDSVDRVEAEPVGGHIADTDGRNYLMVGSDGRTDLSPEERNELGTGWAEGARTDSIMVLHIGGGDPTLLSIPRDSYVEIPGHGMNKINAAFSIGGPPLLAATVEQSTGLHLDGYVEIGFGGFASLVDSVGGVRMCLDAPMQDEKAHIDLPAGCQTLDGKNALGYVRARYSDPEGDLGRVKRQREFLGALMGKIATPSTFVLPWKLRSVGTSAGSAVAIGTEDGMISTGRAFLGLRAVAGGNGNSVTVPISNPSLQTPAGEAVEWDPVKSEELFEALRTDGEIPADLTIVGG